MDYIKKFEKFKMLENKDYEETSWTDGGVTITIKEVQKFLDDNKVKITKTHSNRNRENAIDMKKN